MIKLKLFSDSLELQASSIANQYPFIATITYAGKLSDGYVGGTEGIPGGPYKVLITAELLRRKIKSLQGKAVLVSDLKSHTHNFRIGTFSQAWVESVTLPNGITALAARASGLIIETDDNRDMVEHIIEEARAERLGFSYDIKDVKFDLKASTDSSIEQYVEVTDFEWRGATILKRDAAAYEETQLAASKTTPRKDEDEMTPKELQDAITASLSPLQTSIDSLKTDYANLKQDVASLKAERSTPPKPEDKKDDSATAIASAVAAAVAEANKPVMEAMTKTLEAFTKKSEEQQDPTGVRRSLRFTAAEFKSKYGFGSEELNLDTVEGCEQLIASIHASSLDRTQKSKMLAPIGAQKMELQSLQRRAQSGGAN